MPVHMLAKAIQCAGGGPSWRVMARGASVLYGYVLEQMSASQVHPPLGCSTHQVSAAGVICNCSCQENVCRACRPVNSGCP